MKTIIITEGMELFKKKGISRDEEQSLDQAQIFDIEQMGIKPCCGCWSCWLKTPGRCVSKDLDTFYHHYITADRAIYFIKAQQGFVSSRLKALFDRMIPLYLPYITVNKEECIHVPRYEHYPDVELYYEGDFETEQEREVFVNYIKRTFFQFRSKVITLAPLEKFNKEKRVG